MKKAWSKKSLGTRKIYFIHDFSLPINLEFDMVSSNNFYHLKPLFTIVRKTSVILKSRSTENVEALPQIIFNFSTILVSG